jgi:hypothetical protein
MHQYSAVGRAGKIMDYYDFWVMADGLWQLLLLTILRIFSC